VSVGRKITKGGIGQWGGDRGYKGIKAFPHTLVLICRKPGHPGTT